MTTLIVAQNQFQALLRQKTFGLLLAIFFLLTALSAYIGWSAHHTVEGIYQATAQKLATSGVTEIPDDPFSSTPPLALLKNMLIYVPLIGSLMAIVIGHSSFMRDRKAGVTKVLFSRPLRRGELIGGKIVSLVGSLLLILVGAAIVSWLATGLVTGHFLQLPDTLRLVSFFGLSLLYLLLFALLGLLFSISARSESLALLLPVVIWIGVTFMLPQLISATNPVASLNPITSQVEAPNSRFFAVAQRMIGPISIADRYKELSRRLLNLPSAAPSSSSTASVVLTLGLFVVSLGAACVVAIHRYDVCGDTVYE